MPLYNESGALVVSSGFGDRITDLDGDTYVIAAEEYIDFFANGARYQRIDVNGVQPTEYIAHYGDLDTYLRFTDDRLRVVVGAVDMIDITEAAQDVIEFNVGEADVDIIFNTLVANTLFLHGADGKVGIDTPTIPHGGVGTAMLALDGANAAATGPHVQFTTVTDDYPLLQLFLHSHDQVNLMFDCYYDYVNYLSSDAGSSFRLSKQLDTIRFQYDVAAQGAVITWNDGVVLDTLGKVFIGDTANTKADGPSLTISGDENDGEYFALKDKTDVAHGCTGISETDTFLAIKKISNDDGGYNILGLTDGVIGCHLEAFVTTVNSIKTTAGLASIIVGSNKISGAGTTDLDVNSNIWVVRGRTGAAMKTKFIVDIEGDLFADGGIASTNMVTLYDNFEDAHLVRAFDIARAERGGKPIRDNWSKFIKYNEQKLVDLGILGDTLENGGLTNITRLQQLHNGAIWQNYTAIKDHDKKLVTYERAFEKISRVLGIPKMELLALGN